MIAGYHWFTDWGRDTMISLEGLTLRTGRHSDARYILRTFATLRPRRPHPQPLPRGQKGRAVSHRRRHALVLPRHRPLPAVTSDRETLELLLPMLRDIVAHHLRGTRFGIGVDPSDGLLRQGAGGLSAHLDGRQVRRLGGDAAARQGGRDQRPVVQRPALLESWLRNGRRRAEAADIGGHAERAPASFNQRFWNAEGGYLYDVVDGEKGDDPVLPAQSAFRHLARRTRSSTQNAGRPVLEVVRERLLTPVGLRSLAPGEPDYKPTLPRRPALARRGLPSGHRVAVADRAVRRCVAESASRRHAGRAAFLQGFGGPSRRGVCGIHQRDLRRRAPFTPRGCIAQAWSVAETLRRG